MSIKTQAKLAGFAFAAAVAFSAFGSGEAQAAFNVKQFACTDPGVNVDVSGLGGTNLCITGSVVLDLFCACQNNGGNCPSDAHKQTTSLTASRSLSVQPKNGRVRTSFNLLAEVGDSNCSGNPANLACPGGQDAKLVKFESDGAMFTICTTAAAAGEPCSCEGAPTVGDLPQTQTCPPFSQDLVPACLGLFP
jgi:hypothetical protein